MKFSVLWYIAAILFVDQNKGCSDLKTAELVSPRNFMLIVKNKNSSNFINELKDSYSYRNIYTGVAFVSLTIVLILNHSKKQSRMKTEEERRKQNDLKPAGELLERLEHLRAVFDATAVGVVAIDQDMLVSYMNLMAGRMCGVSPELAIGQPVSAVVRLARGSRRTDSVSRLHDFSTSFCFTDYSTYILRSHDKRTIRVQPIVSPLTVRGEATGTVILLKDISASFKLMKKLAYSASHDYLTGLPNRSSFEKCLENVVDNLAKHASKHALVFLDLDGFKAVNDSAGHTAGDAILKEIARLLQMNLRHSDFLARLAGDEFGLILFNCELTHAKYLMTVIVENIKQHIIYWNEKMLWVGASAGIAPVDGASTSPSELLARADAACYDAKHRGKGQVCVFEESSGKFN